jgi:hypothetical protein
MAERSARDLQRQVDRAFEEFRTTLQAMLVDEAKRSVDGALERMSKDAPFNVLSADVEVTIRDLTLGAAAQEPVVPARRSTTSRRTASRKRSRPSLPRPRRSPVREAILSAFSAGADLNTSELRAALERTGVPSSDANLHQQLRRLVNDGALKRTGHGRYRRIAERSAAETTQ